MIPDKASPPSPCRLQRKVAILGLASQSLRASPCHRWTKVFARYVPKRRAGLLTATLHCKFLFASAYYSRFGELVPLLTLACLLESIHSLRSIQFFLTSIFSLHRYAFAQDHTSAIQIIESSDSSLTILTSITAHPSPSTKETTLQRPTQLHRRRASKGSSTSPMDVAVPPMSTTVPARSDPAMPRRRPHVLRGLICSALAQEQEPEDCQEASCVC